MRFARTRPPTRRLWPALLAAGALLYGHANSLRLPASPLPAGTSQDPAPPEIPSVEPARPPLRGTGAVMADDPAVWVHPTDPGRSLLFLSDKKRGIYVFDLQGNQIQHVEFRTALNNIDVRRGFRFGTEEIDVVAANLRHAGKLAVLRIDPGAAAGHVLTVLADQHSTGNDISADSYGFTLYRRPRDGTVYVFDKSKGKAPVRQWRVDGTSGQVRTSLVRELTDVPMGVAEGFVADDVLGTVYFAEEDRGIHKYRADPDDPASRRLAFFGADDGSVPDREGLALYACADSTGYLVLSSQGNSTFMVYERRGANRLVHSFRASGATGCDGLDVTANPLPGFAYGIAVIHDEPGCRYLVYDWGQIAGRVLVPCSP